MIKKRPSSNIQRLRLKKQHEVCTVLCQWFPKCFLKPQQVVYLKPLKRDIHRDVFQAIDHQSLPLTKTQVRRFFRWYTQQPAYQRALLKGHPRVNLEGKVVEVIAKD